MVALVHSQASESQASDFRASVVPVLLRLLLLQVLVLLLVLQMPLGRPLLKVSVASLDLGDSLGSLGSGLVPHRLLRKVKHPGRELGRATPPHLPHLRVLVGLVCFLAFPAALQALPPCLVLAVLAVSAQAVLLRPLVWLVLGGVRPAQPYPRPLKQQPPRGLRGCHRVILV
ncbi:hypothetical protein BJX66DRAFT_313118, partial [Aspergillus keveii]